MSESTTTAKGLTTVPRDVREKLGARRGTRLEWHITPSGWLIERGKTGPLLDLAGSLKSPDGQRVALIDLNGWR